MKTEKFDREVIDLINSVKDRDIQHEMIQINKNYTQVIVGLRIAKNYLTEIDETTGTDHNEMISNIIELIGQAKNSEIGLLEMSAFYSNDCYSGEHQEEATK